MIKTSTIVLLSVILAAAFIGLPVFAHAQYYNSYCTQNSSQRCVGTSLYWYDSCGNQQTLIQYCQYGCSGNACSINNNYNNNYNNNCNYHAYRLCSGSNIYWYDSCGTQQDLFQSCGSSGLLCQYGQCVSFYQPVFTPEVIFQPAPVIIYRYKTPVVAKPAPTATPTQVTSLEVSFFTKVNSTDTQWQKTVQVGANSTSYFMITVKNDSQTAINNLIVSANIPGQITSIGNVQVNGVAITGDIISGITLAELAPKAIDNITFEGKTQAFSVSAATQATAMTNSNGAIQSDAVSITFNPTIQAAASTSTQTDSGFMAFLKRWYLWILVAIVLIFLFVIIFRRISSST